jgi:hypothetical protein
MSAWTVRSVGSISMFGSRIMLWKTLKNITDHTRVQLEFCRPKSDTLPIESGAHRESSGVATDEDVTFSLCVL